MERKNELLKKKDEKVRELRQLQSMSPSHIWRNDLDALLEKVCLIFSL